MVDRIESRLAEYGRSSLREPGQLPGLEGDDLILTWDIEFYEGGDTIIRYGSKVLWREPSFYEGYWRFIEVADILQRKYGERLQDLVPSRKSELYLYGDSISA